MADIATLRLPVGESRPRVDGEIGQRLRRAVHWVEPTRAIQLHEPAPEVLQRGRPLRAEDACLQLAVRPAVVPLALSDPHEMRALRLPLDEEPHLPFVARALEHHAERF